MTKTKRKEKNYSGCKSTEGVLRYIIKGQSLLSEGLQPNWDTPHGE